MTAEQTHPVTLGTYDEIILRMKANNMGARRIGERFDCSAETIMARIKIIREERGTGRRPQYKLTPVSAGQHDQAIMRMRREGRTLPQIGRTLGCCDRVITRRIAWLRETGVMPKRWAKPEVAQPALKPAESIKRTPQLDALFTKAVMNDIPIARLREIFKCDDQTIREWKRVLGLSGVYAEGAQP